MKEGSSDIASFFGLLGCWNGTGKEMEAVRWKRCARTMSKERKVITLISQQVSLKWFWRNDSAKSVGCGNKRRRRKTFFDSAVLLCETELLVGKDDLFIVERVGIYGLG